MFRVHRYLGDDERAILAECEADAREIADADDCFAVCLDEMTPDERANLLYEIIVDMPPADYDLTAAELDEMAEYHDADGGEPW